jgi:outer membrane protein OmpA-like peptidoglycan-associated protein
MVFCHNDCQTVLSASAKTEERWKASGVGFWGAVMKNQLATLMILAGAVVCCGCAAVVIGAAAGGGAAAYIAGKVTRTYNSEYHQTVRASIETLDSLKLPMSQKTLDESKTFIRAERADGTPISVEVAPTGPRQTEVGVRTGSVGVSELEASERIQNRIRDRLAKLTAEESKATEKSASIPLLETVEEPRRAAVEPKIVLEKERPTATPAISKRASPELTIYFDQDSNELLQSEIVKLNRIAEAFIKKPDLKLTLNGYTDSSGSAGYNRMISESRASTVKMFFAGKGVDPSRITVVGHGAKNFAASNASEEGRQMNRRVEIVLER